MKSKIFFLGFALLFLAQLAVPVSKVINGESVISSGEQFKFLCRPYDPRDLFRGNYMRLGFETFELEYKGEQDMQIQRMKNVPSFAEAKIYVLFTSTDEGIAQAQKYTVKKPKEDGTYLEFDGFMHDAKRNKIIINKLPFEKFFVNENDAPFLEREFAKSQRDKNTYLLVAIKNGRFAVLDLYINGLSSKQIIERAKAQNQEIESVEIMETL